MSQTNNQLLDNLESTVDPIEGIVRMVQFDPTINEYVAWVESNGIKYIIPSSELELFEIRGQINAYVGRKLTFQPLYFDYQRQIMFASCKKVKENERDTIISRLQNGEVFDAKITRLIYFGAYLTIDGIPVMLRNQDFSIDYTTVGDFHEVGDTLRVKFLRINENMKINVQAEEKYQSNSNISIHDFEPHTVVYGLVRSIKSWGCFVNIAPNLDAICPIPNYFEVKEGMKVAFKINQVRIDEGRVRGKIIRIINPQK